MNGCRANPEKSRSTPPQFGAFVSGETALSFNNKDNILSLVFSLSPPTHTTGSLTDEKSPNTIFPFCLRCSLCAKKRESVEDLNGMIRASPRVLLPARHGGWLAHNDRDGGAREHTGAAQQLTVKATKLTVFN